MPNFANIITRFFFTSAHTLMTPAFILLILAALAGMPLFVVIGGISLLLIQGSGSDVDVIAHQIYTALTNSSIVAIPLFTLTGFFLSESKAGERFVIFFKSLVGWMQGGPIIVSVIICAFFTSFTGASGVTILALGGILYTVLTGKSENDDETTIEGRYSPKFAVGLLTSVGSIGLLFPPSLPILLVGATTRTNTIHLFLGGIFPGLILVASMIIFGVIVSMRTKVPIEPFHFKKAVSALKSSALEILLPIFLIAGYFSGILSMVEIGAFAVVYIFVVEVFIFKDIKLSRIKDVLVKAIPIIGGVLSILALAQALSYYIVDSQVPENFTRWMHATISSRWLFLLILNIALLITGCLVDIFSAILIVLPLIAPLGEAYGINQVHLGIIFLINMEAGFLTPPVGLNLFLASYRFKKPFIRISHYVVPFLVIQLIVVFLVTYVPDITMWFTNLY
jgi:tripartite ATP-independent transporter DctM subunit